MAPPPSPPASPEFSEQGARPPLWGGLEPGPHAAGFRLDCRLDYSRLYAQPYHHTPGLPRGPKCFRPILQATWYPARQAAGAERMRYREYFAPEGAGPEYLLFLTRLFAFSLDMACRYGLHKPLAGLAPQERAAVEGWLDTRTAAIKEAPPAAGRFPLVVYHPGLSSSYEDNSVFCEYLATHGYVVVSSAYPPEEADNTGIDGDFDRSVRDFRFLLNSALAEPNADPERIGVMGHSYGAHTASGLLGLVNAPVDAVVSLDSTLEYWLADAELFAKVRTRLSHAERMTAPMLIFAGMRRSWVTTEGIEGGTNRFEPPIFDFYDTLPYADRWYAEVHHLDHGDFVSQGAMLGRFRRSLAGDAATGKLVWETFGRVCLCTHQFLDATLKRGEPFRGGDPGDALFLRHAEASPPPPAPHHLMEILEADGPGLEQRLAAVAALCERFPEHLDPNALRRAAGGLRQRQKEPEALALMRLAVGRFPARADVFSDLGDALKDAGRVGEAADCYRAALGHIEADTALDEEARKRAAWHLQQMLDEIRLGG